MLNINLFAKTNFKGEGKIFGIKKEDRRLHMYIIGKTVSLIFLISKS